MPVEQVLELFNYTCFIISKTVATFVKTHNLFAFQVKNVGNENTNAKLRSEVIKHIKDLFDLKQVGAITQEEYDDKKEILLKDL